MHDVVDVEEAEVGLLDSVADDIVDDEGTEYYMPWTVEEEVVTCKSIGQLVDDVCPAIVRVISRMTACRRVY